VPVATFHTVGCTPAQRRRLLVEGSATYAAVLDSPVERVRVYVTDHAPDAVAVGGEVVAEGAPAAPFFTAIVLAGRPAEQRERLLAELTAVAADVLEVDPSLVRGHVVQVDPEDWGIGGRTAAQARATEIRDRAAAGSGEHGPR
jgi:phenylpyruvate tautomerase PptA (4-oxalocrotonate tautomerase family)